eukprot:scaffold110589_cov17-Tisochrysis_lutea.AAC.2
MRDLTGSTQRLLMIPCPLICRRRFGFLHNRHQWVTHMDEEQQVSTGCLYQHLHLGLVCKRELCASICCCHEAY